MVERGMWATAMLASALATVTPSNAQVAITCEAPAGWSVMLGGGGWERDGLSGGTVTLAQDVGGRWDVIYATDSNRFTARQDGATITVVTNEGSAGSVILTLTYPLGVVEVLHLSQGRGGRELAIVSARPSIWGASPRSSLFSSRCK